MTTTSTIYTPTPGMTWTDALNAVAVFIVLSLLAISNVTYSMPEMSIMVWAVTAVPFILAGQMLALRDDLARENSTRYIS